MFFYGWALHNIGVTATCAFLFLMELGCFMARLPRLQTDQETGFSSKLFYCFGLCSLVNLLEAVAGAMLFEDSQQFHGNSIVLTTISRAAFCLQWLVVFAFANQCWGKFGTRYACVPVGFEQRLLKGVVSVYGFIIGVLVLTQLFVYYKTIAPGFVNSGRDFHSTRTYYETAVAVATSEDVCIAYLNTLSTYLLFSALFNYNERQSELSHQTTATRR